MPDETTGSGPDSGSPASGGSVTMSKSDFAAQFPTITAALQYSSADDYLASLDIDPSTITDGVA
jgi:hypothetical protein